MALAQNIKITETFSVKVKTSGTGAVVQSTDYYVWDMGAKDIFKSVSADFNKDYHVITTLKTAGDALTLPTGNYRYLAVWASGIVTLGYKVAGGAAQTVDGIMFRFFVKGSDVLDTITVTSTVNSTYVRVYAVFDIVA